MARVVALGLLAAVISGVTFAAGLIGSRLLGHALGLSAPRLPAQAPESMAGLYLLAGSIVLAGGLVPVARGVATRFWMRWAALAVLLFMGFAVSTTIEASIYTSATGSRVMILVLLLPCVALALSLAAAARPRFVVDHPGRRFLELLQVRPWPERVWRIGAAVASFPLIYFAFGIAVAPIVATYYESGVAGLTLPSPGLIVQVQLLRGLIHVVSVVPVIVLWGEGRRHLVPALASAFFVFVFTYDIVLAIRAPVVLVVTHGVEVLLGSIAFAWVAVRLLAPGIEAGGGHRRRRDDQDPGAGAPVGTSP
ncbi:MAG: hypothetical protein AB1625_01490 [Acidobacteriota bacterium]